jgi:hypothetical protein
VRSLSKRQTSACVLLAGMAFGVTQAAGSSGSASDGTGEAVGAAPASSPFASYAQPTGPELSDSSMRSVALREAARAGDSKPSRMTGANATYDDAAKALDPGATRSPPSSEREASYRQSAVVVVVLHGHFTLKASTPAGRRAPSGQVLSIVIDAHTGLVEFRAIEESEPELAQLGPARPLQ